MLVSISEGDCRDGLFGAILFKAADDIVVGDVVEKEEFVKRSGSDILPVWEK
jgi:hypothetical protein